MKNDYLFPEFDSKYIYIRYNLLSIQKKELMGTLRQLKNTYSNLKTNSKLVNNMERKIKILNN